MSDMNSLHESPAVPQLDAVDVEKSGPSRMMMRIQFVTRLFALPWQFIRSRVSEAVLLLSGWFLVNLLITIYNKAVFQFANFHYPMITTAIHLACTLGGVVILRKLNMVESASAPGWDAKYLKIVMFSILFTGNIWLSNWSVMVASLPLNQILRASVPLFTVAINYSIFKEEVNPKVLPPIAIVILGCGLTVSGDLSTSTFGIILVVISCAVSSLKGIVSQKAQVNDSLSTTDVLRYMCPLALIELMIGAAISGELQTLLSNADQMQSLSLWIIMLGAGLLAFLTNMLSMRAVVVSDPLTMNVLANLKQVITSFLAIPLFGSQANFFLFVGVIVACIGSYWYGSESHKYKAMMKAQLNNAEADQTNVELENQPSDESAVAGSPRVG